jgi:hypothetical protein
MKGTFDSKLARKSVPCPQSYNARGSVASLTAVLRSGDQPETSGAKDANQDGWCRIV